MEGFVDIHTHILPGVDDGAPDLAAAMALLEKAHAAGTRTLYLTPHFRGRFRDNTAEKLLPLMEQLRAAAAEKFPELTLRPGCEIHYQSDAPQKLLDGELLCMNGTEYVLLEFDFGARLREIYAGVDGMLSFGFVPIIAHAERYAAFLEKKDLAEELCRAGVLIQLNADSILGETGFKVKRYCHRLLEDGLVHFIASDAHDLDVRQPVLRACYEKIAKKYAPEYADALFRENALQLL